jgi:hypothetical protein
MWQHVQYIITFWHVSVVRVRQVTDQLCTGWFLITCSKLQGSCSAAKISENVSINMHSQPFCWWEREANQTRHVTYFRRAFIYYFLQKLLKTLSVRLDITEPCDAKNLQRLLKMLFLSLKIIGPCDAKNSWLAENFLACVLLLSQPLESNAEARPACWLFSSKLCPSDDLQVEVGRSVSSYPSVWVVRILNLLCVAGELIKSHIMHKPHCLSRCQWYRTSPRSWDNNSV